MTQVDTRAGAVCCTERGDHDGLPIVLLHAALHDHHDFDPIVPALAHGHRTIAVDWPGHGSSASAGQAITAPLLADVLEDVVDALDLPPALLIGNSVGGFAAARLAARRPQRVAGLVLVNTGGFVASNLATRGFCRAMGTPAITRRALGPFIGAYMRASSDNDRAIATRARARARTPEGTVVAASLWRSFATPEHDLRPIAGQITAPTLIVWGTKDVAIPLSAGRAAQRAIAGSRLETLKTGHVVFSSDPGGFMTLVRPFIASLAPDTAAEREATRHIS